MTNCDDLSFAPFKHVIVSWSKNRRNMEGEREVNLRIKPSSILDEYEVSWRQKLGTGISGPVRPCKKRSTGKRYALKCLVDRPKARTEVALHYKCSGHPNIVTIYDVYANDVQFPGEPQPKARLLVVMELMDGGELFDRISQQKCFTEREASCYTKQIAAAIQRCHTLNIAHRDLKPENLLLKDNSKDAVIKLSDFGFAKIDDGNLMTPHFTPYYVAPQVLEAQKQQHRDKNTILPAPPYTYDKSCDMWSLGVIIYIMLCGYPPFYSETPSKQITREMKTKIMAGQYDFPQEEWNNISVEAKDLIQRLLHVEPSQRLNIVDVLTHPWLEEAPATELSSPGIMLDKNMLEDIKEAHSQQLTTMRMPDIQLTLKPLKQVNNPIIKKRLLAGQSQDDNRRVEEPPVKQTSQEMALQRIRDVIALLILPPKDETDYDENLSILVDKACQMNIGCKHLHEVLNQWDWDGEKFQQKLDKNQLAQDLSQVVLHKQINRE